MKLSVIVPTYNREERLVATLKMLANQDFSDFEVLVIDQSKSHNATTEKTIDAYKKDSRFKFFKLEEAHFTKAKNFGVKKASAEIILNIDDDLEFGRNFLKLHFKNYADLSISAVGGKIKDRITGKEITGAKGPKMNWRGEFNWARDLREVWMVGGGNMSFRKERWEKVHGFDENFFGNSAYEDVDFCLRIKKSGGKIIYEPEAEALHLKAFGGLKSFGDKKSWFEQLFANYFYFCLKNYQDLWIIHILKQWRAIGRCAGSGGIWAIIRGFHKGYNIYKNYKKYRR